MSFATERKKRPNAGSRMNALLNQEIEMEELFEYQESDSDQEFSGLGLQEEEDKVDSDFDLDSSEGEKEHEEEGKALDKEIAKEEKKSRKNALPNTTIKTPRKPAERKKRKKEELSENYEERGVRQSFRRNTMLNRILLEGQLKEDQKKKAAQPKREKTVSYEMTQEELIAEALVTEKKNMSSLLEWQKKEEERQANAKIKEKKELEKPFVRYHSYIERCEESTSGDDEKEKDKSLTEPMGRNLITFMESIEKEDPEDLEFTGLVGDLASWLDKNPKPNKPIACPISGKPAIYKEPRTGVHYADVQSYKKIQSCLKNQMRWSSTLDLYLGDLPSAGGVPESWDS
ncbi:YL1 nuclear protein-domain-containing protein [Sporodiniella umbellata]|nr:YL1 nuclear protein-domain-containing protein [Sporodiniella umbellata]